LIKNIFHFFTFANGSPKKASEINQSEKISFVENIVKMHKLAKRFKSKFKRNNRDLFCFDFEEYIFKLYPKVEFLCFLRKELDSIKINIGKKSDKILKIAIHNDLSINNIFFKDNKVSSIVDFDDCCFGARISDLANAIFDFYCDGFRLHKEEINFFIDQYSRSYFLENDEIDIMNDLLKYRLIIYILFYFYYWKITKKDFYLKNYQKYYKILKIIMNMYK